jgi:hypothetical protein
MEIRVYIPTRDQFCAGIAAYEQKESRGPMYFKALRKLREGWSKAEVMADAIWLLLKSWHRQFYRFGPLDPKVLATCIERNTRHLDYLRSREIESLCTADELTVRVLFREFTVATRRSNRSGLQDSTVATAKALHLLSPGLLPLWDNPIAWHYGHLLMWSEDYVSFCWEMKELAAPVKGYVHPTDDRTLLKRIDEFNYAAYTKHWIQTGEP